MFWNKFSFTYERTFNTFGFEERPFVWRKTAEEFKDQNIRLIKHGGGGVMVSGCMSAAGRGNLMHSGQKHEYRHIATTLKGLCRKINN